MPAKTTKRARTADSGSAFAVGQNQSAEQSEKTSSAPSRKRIQASLAGDTGSRFKLEVTCFDRNTAPTQMQDHEEDPEGSGWVALQDHALAAALKRKAMAETGAASTDAWESARSSAAGREALVDLPEGG